MHQRFKKILCVRPDNMGDVVMSGPAIRALKTTFQCHITLLTSPMGALISNYVPGIDATLVCTIPWVKTGAPINSEAGLLLAEQIRAGGYDAAVIFTVYSQSALPAALLLYLSDVPVRLAYCRENPYGLLTHWIPDQEPYSYIRHQVTRDLELVKAFDAYPDNEQLIVTCEEDSKTSMRRQLLEHAGIDTGSGYIVVHPGVSEPKRKYPLSSWIATAAQLTDQLSLPVIVSGSVTDKEEAGLIASGAGCFSLAGQLSMQEWIALIHEASLVVSVNTGTIHIAAATQTPVVVLYALTNPQHTPWRSPSIVLPFSVHPDLKSKNEVIRYVDDTLFTKEIAVPAAEEVVAAAIQLLQQPSNKRSFHGMNSFI